MTRKRCRSRFRNHCFSFLSSSFKFFQIRYVWIFYKKISWCSYIVKGYHVFARSELFHQLIELIDHVLNENVYAIWSSPKLLYLSSHWNNLLDDDRRVKRSTTDWSNYVEEIRLLLFSSNITNRTRINPEFLFASTWLFKNSRNVMSDGFQVKGECNKHARSRGIGRTILINNDCEKKNMCSHTTKHRLTWRTRI